MTSLVSWLAFVSVGLLASQPAFAAGASEARAPLALWVDTCLDERRTSIEQIVSLELERAVMPMLAPQPASGDEQVLIQCEAGALILSYQRAGARRGRSLETSGISKQALARTVALAVVELVEAPEPHSRATVAQKPQLSRAAVAARPPPLPRRTRVALLATGRFFPRRADWSWGARLRSHVLQVGRGALLLGVGGEKGSAARAPGSVVSTAAYAELGFEYELSTLAPFSLAISGAGEAGYVVLSGQPRLPTTTEGKQLKAAWVNAGLALSPRLKLSSRLELTSRVGLGFMLLGPSADSDSSTLDVWRGLDASADLGICVSL